MKAFKHIQEECAPLVSQFKYPIELTSSLGQMCASQYKDEIGYWIKLGESIHNIDIEIKK